MKCPKCHEIVKAMPAHMASCIHVTRYKCNFCRYTFEVPNEKTKVLYDPLRSKQGYDDPTTW
jgi:transposase-like protein